MFIDHSRVFKGAGTALLSVCLITSGIAEAKRLGGGRSSGRSYSSPSYSSSSYGNNSSSGSSSYNSATNNGSYRNTNSNSGQNNYGSTAQNGYNNSGSVQQPTTYTTQRPGVSTGTLAGAALAAGAAGYMLGHSNNADATTTKQSDGTTTTYSTPYSSQNSANKSSSSILGMLMNLFIILLLGMAAYYLFSRFKKKKQQPAYGSVGGSNSFGRDSSQSPMAKRNIFGQEIGSSGSSSFGSGSAPTTAPESDAAFLRNAKGIFNHLQALNHPQQLTEIQQYLTPELFDELKSEIGSNNELPEFEHVKADLVGTFQNGPWLIREVQFDGLVSEHVGEPFTPFSEKWEFVKPAAEPNAPWRLARIEIIG